MRKGYEVSEERRLGLARRYPGFGYRGTSDPYIHDDYARTTQSHGPGKPGLSIAHRDYSQDRSECPSKGVGCDSDYHSLVYRNRHGEPMAYAHTSRYDDYQDNEGKAYKKNPPMVTSMGSDRSHGVATAIAVGHVAHHLGNIGVEPDTSLTAHSQRLVSHGLEHQERGTDSKLKQYLARRAERVAKGYKMDRAAGQRAREFAGAAHSPMYEPDDWARDELKRVPKGKPGLSIHRNVTAYGGGWSESPARFVPRKGRHLVAYRDPKGQAVTLASMSGRNDPYHEPGEGRHTEFMVSDRRRGAVHAIGTAHVASALYRLKATQTREMTSHSQRMVAHSIDRPERTAKIVDYLAQRRKRS